MVTVWLDFSYKNCFPQGLKARDFIRKRIEENIRRKLKEDDTQDALRILMEQDTETGETPSIEVRTCSR